MVRGYNLCGEKPLIINFGGEGEIAGAVNVNNFMYLMRPALDVRAHVFIRADMREVPLPDSVADEVYGNKLPMEATENWAGRVCREAYRLLKPTGQVQFYSVTGGADVWLSWLRAAGFADVAVIGRYATGTKPEQHEESKSA